MLRITVISDQQGATFKAEGKLTREWLGEAEKAWMVFSTAQKGKRMIVDLCGISFVDDLGRELLARMHLSGARLVGTGPMMGPLIDEVCGSVRKPRRRWMRRVLSPFFLMVLILAACDSNITNAQGTAASATPLTLERALVDAGTLPVMITLGARVLAFLPLTSHEEALWKPDCCSQVGGLRVATFINLLLVKIYTVFCAI